MEAVEHFNDVPLFFDLMFLYWRSQADCLSIAIPRFYGPRRKRARIPDGSFREHVKWHRKHRDFDPVYSSILDDSTAWFTMLAGETRGDGLRDNLVHHLATFQIGTRGNPREVFAEIVKIHNLKFVPIDVTETLKASMRSYCQFLDRAVRHFVPIIESQVGPVIASDVIQRSDVYVRPTPDPTYWLYPEVAPRLRPEGSCLAPLMTG